MFQPNSVIAGRYEVIRLVGQGGMSNLYLAHDRKYNNAIVVIKEMTAAYSDPKEQQMAVDLFHREAKLLSSLNHRHIPKVYDYFQFAGKYYLSMEFIDGEDLAQKLEATKGPLPEAQVLEWAEQIATVLFYLHKHEPPIVFRDVKPSNIMLCDQGVKLIDFGIARHFDQAKKGDTMRIGSPGYAPPEQYAAQTDPRSDIYALGVTLHHALTGRDPTTTSTPFLVPPARKLNPSLSEGTAAMLARATQLDPADRYQSVLEMKNDIKHVLQRGHQSTRVVGAPPPPPGPAVVSAPLGAAAQAAQAAQAVAGTTAQGAQAAQAVQGAQGAAGTAAQSAPAAQVASGPPVAAGTTAGTPGGPVAVVNTVVPAKSKKPRRWRGRLLAACVLLSLGGGLYAAGDEGRSALYSRLQALATSVSQKANSKTPEEAINDMLMQGDPKALLPLFGQSGLSTMNGDKQALYRLNLLAAGVANADSPPGIVHLLYPETVAGKDGSGEARLYRGAARAVGAVNAQGGLGKQLLVVIPRAYASGELDETISKLAAAPSHGGQRIVLVDPASDDLLELSPESKSQQLFVLGQGAAEKTTAWLADEPSNLAQLYSLEKRGGEGKLLWAAEGAPPAGKVEKVDLGKGGMENLGRLLARSASEGATLVVESDRLPEGELSDIPAGRLLLLGVGSSALPALSSSVKADALVLGSPLREAVAPSQNGASQLYLSPAQSLSLQEARVFDAIVLATLPAETSFSGITVVRTREGAGTPGVPVRYHWTGKLWIPALGEK